MIWVLIDVSWLAYRALHTVGSLEHDGDVTGVIFGFFQQLRDVCQHPRVRSNRVALFCDSRRSLRAEAYPAYKGRREERSPEEAAQRSALHEQLQKLQRDILPEMGIPIYEQDGLESDDLIAEVAHNLSVSARYRGEQMRQAVMITSDGDLYQSITAHVHWFDPQRDVYHDPTSFQAKRGIVPNLWGEVKALAGCHSDNVVGIPGVGEATAVKYVLGDLPAKYKAYEAITSKRGREIAAQNREFVLLPHQATEHVWLREPTYDAVAFFRWCERLGFESFLREREAWISFFGGRRFQTRKRGEKV